MQRIENWCCGCSTEGYPCQGEICSYRNVVVTYCDICGEEIPQGADGDTEICEDCASDLGFTES